MSTTKTKVTHTWAAQHTAGHGVHGQTAIYDETTGKDIAIVYDGDAHAEFIVRAVNSHADMLEALESAQAIIQLWHDDARLPKAQEYLANHLARIGAAIAKARGVA